LMKEVVVTSQTWKMFVYMCST